MAYDEGLAQRLREVVSDRGDVLEKRMFGGLAFMVRGHMAFGVVKDELMVRVGKDGHAAALERPHARPMTFTGKSIKTMVYVGTQGFEEDADLDAWVKLALDFNATEDVKVSAPKKAGSKKKAAPKKKKR